VFELWFVRHGQTDWNVEQRIQGWLDVPLNRDGREQSERLARAMQNVPIQHIFSSDLVRARETAEILARGRNCPICLEPLLRERRFGPLEGRRRTDVPGEASTADAVPYPPIDPALRDAETDSAFIDRARTFLEQVAHAPLQGRVLAVTHGGFIRAALMALGHEAPAALHNTSVTKLRWQNGWTVEVVDWAEHLQDSPCRAALESDLVK
jgi:broad specificity phosphatase PhoE